MRSKTAFITSGLATLLLYFGFILLVIIFYFILKLTIGESLVKIYGHIGDSDTNYEISNFLKTPVKFKIDDRELSTDMAGLIVMHFLAQGTINEGKFQNLIGERTKEIFGEKHPHLKWKLKVSDKILNLPKAIASGQTTSKLTKEKTLVKGMAKTCFILPNPELKNPIKIEFDFLNLNADAFERSNYESLKNTEFNC